MPLYELKCEKCNHIFEVIQKYDEPLPICENKECDGEIKKIVSKTSFALKGGGWFKDGYSTKKKSQISPKENKPETN